MYRRRYQLPRPRPPASGGAGLEQTFVFPQQQQQQPPRGVRAPEQPRVEVPPFDAPAPQQTYLFPLSQPLNRRGYQVRPSITARKGTATPTSADVIFTAPTIQAPEPQYRALVDAIRYRQDAVPAVHQGPTVDIAAGWQSVSSVHRPHAPRQYVPQALPILGAAAAATETDIFRLIDAVPPNRYGVRPAPVITFRNIRGLTPPVQVPLTPVYVQPSAAWWARIDRAGLVQRSATVPLFTGLEPQQTYLFPVSQPEQIAWNLRRAATHLAVPGPRLDGTEPLASFLFLVSQPVGWTLERVVSRFLVTPQLEGVFVPPPVAQTYLFPPDQPSRTQWYVPRTPSEQVPAPPQIAQGATVLSTDPVPGVSHPDRGWWQWRLVDILIGTGDRVTMTAGRRPFSAAWVVFNRYMGPWDREPK